MFKKFIDKTVTEVKESAQKMMKEDTAKNLPIYIGLAQVGLSLLALLIGGKALSQSHKSNESPVHIVFIERK